MLPEVLQVVQTSDTTTATELVACKKIDVHISDPFTRLDQGHYLHDRSEKDVFKVLIDALRLHKHDVVNFDHAVDEGSVYAGEDSSIKDFRNFLHLATSKPGILPSWWDAEKQKECEAFSESNYEWSLANKVTKEGIKRKYGVDNMPMQLRMFAEAIYGRTPRGFDSTGTRGMLVKLERCRKKSRCKIPGRQSASRMVNVTSAGILFPSINVKVPK